MDEKHKVGQSNVDTKLLGDIVVTPMPHLETTGAMEGHKRSVKMIRGLGVFMEGRTALDDWWLKFGEDKARQQHDPTDGTDTEGKKRKRQLDSDPASTFKRHLSLKGITELEVAGQSTSLDGHPKPTITTSTNAEIDHTAGLLVALTNQQDASAIHAPATSISQESLSIRPLTSAVSATPNSAHATPPTSSRGQDQQPAGLKRTFTPELQESLISQSLKEMFARASSIIQESIEVDGVVFLDARMSPLERRKGESPKTIGYFALTA